jgi:AP-4 complex subunit beta-1
MFEGASGGSPQLRNVAHSGFAFCSQACNTKDLVIKKMVYLYLCSYAQSNPELTLLAINTLQKDCRDEDPMVRGLALRSLTGLRLSSILEYVMSPLKAALTDSSGYVRQAGVIGLLKVYHLAPHLIKEPKPVNDGSGFAPPSSGSSGGFVDTLYSMMRDRDPQVVINCIQVLSEILMDEGGIAVNQAIIHYLLTRLKEFNDWGQCVVLEMVSKYIPVGGDDECFGIMNLLDPYLKVANSAVVLGTTKAFLNLTKNMGPELTAQVFLRLKTPILTILAASSPEISYPVLSHVLLICDKANELEGGRVQVFDEDFKAFFCKVGSEQRWL